MRWTMKVLNGILIFSLGLILFGVIYFVNQEEEVPEGSTVTIALSLNHDVFQFNQEDGIIYILEGTVQEDILDKLVAQDGSTQQYRITTSEGSSKSLDEIYEFDRLYVTAENGVEEDYYYFEYVDELN